MVSQLANFLKSTLCTNAIQITVFQNSNKLNIKMELFNTPQFNLAIFVFLRVVYLCNHINIRLLDSQF